MQKREKYKRPKEPLVVTHEVRAGILQSLCEWKHKVHDILVHMESVPQTLRPDWYQHNIDYWRHLRTGLNWIIKQELKRGSVDNGIRPASSETADSIIQGRGFVKSVKFVFPDGRGVEVL